MVERFVELGTHSLTYTSSAQELKAPFHTAGILSYGRLLQTCSLPAEAECLAEHLRPCALHRKVARGLWGSERS